MYSPVPITVGYAADPVHALLASTPYRALGLLGRGGMGEVHMVEHKSLCRRFALKVIRARLADKSQLADRMRIEAQAAARLNHPNIVQVVDFWIAANGRPCMVMELLQGQTLAAELIARRRLPVAEAVHFTCQLLSALSAAHDLGVVHRDIKPENLFLHQPADHPRLLKVLDFGIARVLPDAMHLAPLPLNVPTATGTFLGSPKYASPEAAGGKQVDHRADLYSVGLILYSMVTGRGAFDRMGPHDDWSCYEAAPPSRHIGSAVTPELDTVVLKSIQFVRTQRFQSARAFSDQLLPIMEGTYGKHC